MKKLLISVSVICFTLATIVVADENEKKWDGLRAAAHGGSFYKSLTRLEGVLGAMPIEGCEWGMKLITSNSTSEMVVKSVILKRGHYYYYEDTMSKIGSAARKVSINPKLDKNKLRKLPKIQELNKYYKENKHLYSGLTHTQYMYFEWCSKRKIWLSEKMPPKKVEAGFYDRINDFLNGL